MNNTQAAREALRELDRFRSEGGSDTNLLGLLAITNPELITDLIELSQLAFEEQS